MNTTRFQAIVLLGVILTAAAGGTQADDYDDDDGGVPQRRFPCPRFVYSPCVPCPCDTRAFEICPAYCYMNMGTYCVYYALDEATSCAPTSWSAVCNLPGIPCPGNCHPRSLHRGATKDLKDRGYGWVAADKKAGDYNPTLLNGDQQGSAAMDHTTHLVHRYNIRFKDDYAGGKWRYARVITVHIKDAASNVVAVLTQGFETAKPGKSTKTDVDSTDGYLYTVKDPLTSGGRVEVLMFYDRTLAEEAP